jgi:hypothetical protein
MKKTMTIVTLAAAASIAAAQSSTIEVPSYLQSPTTEFVATSGAPVTPVDGVAPAVVPAPAGAAVLGMAGLFAARRRRA